MKWLLNFDVVNFDHLDYNILIHPIQDQVKDSAPPDLVEEVIETEIQKKNAN